jgi:DNA-binding HxlR family transcriptional regulator
MSGYSQFCPVAKATEVLDQRWTLLVVRELLLGSSRFNDLRRGVPKMSPALLSKRLRELERAGIVERRTAGRSTEYHLTPGGEELRGVVTALGIWGLRWMPELGDEDYDPHLLMWDIRRTIDVENWPRARTVVAIHFTDKGVRDARWWLVVSEGEVDLCDVDPGYAVTATITTRLRVLTTIWRGDLSWAQGLRSDQVSIDAPTTVKSAIPDWMGQSGLAVAAAAGQGASA